jgi:hypothetical protein
LRELSKAPESNARSAALQLSECFEALRSGDRTRFHTQCGALAESTRGFAPARVELADFRAAIDLNSGDASDELARWRRGETPLTPASVHGLRVRSKDGEESAGAYVLCIPPEPGLRLLHWGVPLLDVPGLKRIAQSRRAQGRVETVLAILALAGGAGLDEKDCFRAAYEFELVPELHRGVFDVLLHRVRTAVEGMAELERSGGRLALVPRCPLLVPDPRVSQRTTDRVLRLLAERGSASAKDAAGLLGISLRSAQNALAELAGSGACDSRKQGRNVAYVVEDTIFSEPSRRLVASDLTGLTRLG